MQSRPDPISTTDLPAMHDASTAPAWAGGRALAHNIVVQGRARFTVLGPGLIRMERSNDGAFEDRRSFFALHRDAPAQNFTAQVGDDGWLRIRAARLELRYREDGRPFHPGNLGIRVFDLQGRRLGDWIPGSSNPGNLGGTLRTLDECEASVDLGQGLLSRDGWFLKEDNSVLLSDDARAWAAPRLPGRQDGYFFGYGRDYVTALGWLMVLSGRIPVPPRWSFGSWYSRYWPYSGDELLSIVDEYREHGFPLDVMVIDMDWHREGWTGYSWNHDLIADPEGLLLRLHQRGLRNTLNLHPHDGVGAHEDAYPQFTRDLGLDPAMGAKVPFDVTDPDFMQAYFRRLLHPLEAQGVDFWWMDWQQGTTTGLEGLDPLAWLNHLHYRDRQRSAKVDPGGPPLRGMNFSRWAGWGDQRHPVQFSGDTHSNWEVLEFLTLFTVTAGNVGAAYWSHDLGGHFGAGGRIDPELYLRWLQLGALSPVMRLHSSRDPLNDRRPWLDGPMVEAAARKAYALRSRLVPYLYSAAHACYQSGVPLLRPLYLEWPAEDEAYRSPGQFLLGPDLLVISPKRPGHGRVKVAQVRAWFPAGEWYHWETHERLEGPLLTTVAVPLDGVALYMRGGAPLCLKDAGTERACDLGGPRVLKLYPGVATQRLHVEDDGETLAYQAGDLRRLHLATRLLSGGAQALTLGPWEGPYRPQGEAPRSWVLELAGVAEVDAPKGVVTRLERSEGLTRVHLRSTAADEVVELVLSWDRGMLAGPAGADLQVLVRRLNLAARQGEPGTVWAAELDALAGAAKDELGRPLEGAASEARVETLRRRAEALLTALAAAGPSAEGAQRVLAGVSLQAFAVNGEGSQVCLELVYLRDQHAAEAQRGPCLVRWRLEGGGWSCHELAPGLEREASWNLDLPVPPTLLAVTRGELELQAVVDGRLLTLRESFSWDGRAVKDWKLAGPLPRDKGRRGPARLVDAGLARTLVGLEGPVKWAPRRFDPVRTARGIRHFYDLGEAFVCPGGAVLALAVLEASKAEPVTLVLYHEGEARAWLNGVALELEGGPRLAVVLRTGPNLLAVEVSGGKHAGRGLSVSVEQDPRLGALDLRSRPATDF